AKIPARLLYSARGYADLIYREELAQLAAAGSGLDVFYTLTRSQPAGWTGYARRLDNAMLAEVAQPLRSPQVFICGPTLLVEAAANGLEQVGVPAKQIRTERFGFSGT